MLLYSIIQWALLHLILQQEPKSQVISFSKQYSLLNVLARPLPEVGSISRFWKEWLWCSCRGKKVMAVAFVHSWSRCTVERLYTGSPWQLCQYLSIHLTNPILVRASSAQAKNYLCIVLNMHLNINYGTSLDDKNFRAAFLSLRAGGFCAGHQ